MPLFTIGLAVVALLVLMASRASGPGVSPRPATPHRHAAGASTATAYGFAPAPSPSSSTCTCASACAAGCCSTSAQARSSGPASPERVLPIASLTKMMTALLVAADSRPSDRVLVTRAAVHFSGSGIGLLPLGKRVPLLALLYGLLLPSGNDAAIALAQHVAGTQQRFIAMMNVRAHAMGLRCTHFTTVSGIVDQGNYSCAGDLAQLAHAVLQVPLLARIVASRSAVVRFPIKGGHLWLYNNNPLLVLRFPGTDGVKTGYTLAAGRCLIATARRGRAWLGVVLLHSADPPDQAEKLLDAGFRALRTG